MFEPTLDTDSKFQAQYIVHLKTLSMSRFQITFNSNPEEPGILTVGGFGRDEVGLYVLQGKFKSENGRLVMNKAYQMGTGIPYLNLGQTVKLQVIWHCSNQKFVGQFYDKTEAYERYGKWEMQPIAFNLTDTS